MAALALAGCASPRPGASSSAGARIVAQQLARSGAASVIVFVSDHGHSTVATAGTAPPAAGQRFRIGSVTKTFTATLVLQLVDQKRIGLDDPVGRYLPGVIPAGGTITIRELLQHTLRPGRLHLLLLLDGPGRAIAVYQADRRAAVGGLPASAVRAGKPVGLLQHQLHRARARHRKGNRAPVRPGTPRSVSSSRSHSAEPSWRQHGDYRTSMTRAPIRISDGRQE